MNEKGPTIVAECIERLLKGARVGGTKVAGEPLPGRIAKVTECSEIDTGRLA